MHQKYRTIIWIMAGVAVFLLIQRLATSAIDIGVLRAYILNYGTLAPAIFLLLYIVLTLLMVSTAALSIVSGLLFGIGYGVFYTTVAATLAGMIGFFLTRRYGVRLSKRLEHSSSRMVRNIRKELHHHGFRGIFIIRCLFLPYMGVSYAAGLLKEVKTSDFFWATLSTNILFGFFFVLLGDQLIYGWKAVILPLVIIVLLLTVSIIVERIRSKSTRYKQA